MRRSVKDHRAYRGYVGRPEGYDLLAANQLMLLFQLGLREHHRVLDLGCGSLRLGRLLMPFLRPAHYHAVEPEPLLIQAGLENEVGWDILRVKQPRFLHVRDFSLGRFQARFDFVIAHSIFTHTYPDLAITGLTAVAEVLDAQGVLVATFIERDTPERPLGSGWLYPDCLAHTPKEIDSFFRRSGLEAHPMGFPHPDQMWWIARRAIR